MSATEQTRPNVVLPLRHARMLIAGAWAEALGVGDSGQETEDRPDPTWGAADVNWAVHAATQTFPGWSKTRVRRHLQRLAPGARGESWAGTGRDPLERRGRGDPYGE